MKKKTAKEVKMHKFLARACKSQDFAQILKIFAQSHDCMTVTFRNSVQYFSVCINALYLPTVHCINFCLNFGTNSTTLCSGLC